jgi:hypothetical protein
MHTIFQLLNSTSKRRQEGGGARTAQAQRGGLAFNLTVAGDGEHAHIKTNMSLGTEEVITEELHRICSKQ